jgi:hypothetical protein
VLTHHRSAGWVLLLLVTGACSKHTSAAGPPMAFAVPQVGMAPDITALPWPSDLYLDANGHPVVASLAPLTDTPFLDTVRADLATRDGFAVTAGAFFAPPANLDRASVEGRILLLDLEGGAPVPVTWFHRADHLLHVRPANGHVLLQRHRYAYVIVNGITAGGLPLSPSSDFQVLRDASAAPTDARLARGWTVMSPLFKGLDARSIQGGPAKSDVICAAVFTTQSITALLEAAHDVVGAQPANPAQVAYLYAADPRAGDDASLDDLMTHPDTIRPGCVSSCVSPDEGILHDQMAFVVQGALTVPDFLAPTVPSFDPKHPNASVQGRIKVDPAGRPIIQGQTLVPFTLVLPKLASGATYAQVPVLVYQHGLGGDRESLLAVANTLAKAGIATIGIDMPFHGLREASAVDHNHNIGCHTDSTTKVRTCPPGADGFSDTNGDALFYFFDIVNPPGSSNSAFDPSFVRGAFQEAVIDLMSLVHFVSDGSFDVLGKVDPRLIGLSFKAGPYMYLAESFGSIMGGMLFAVEPKIAGGTLVVAGGGLFIPLSVWSADFNPLASPVISSVAQLDPSGDPPETDLAYNLLQQLVEPGDSLALSPYVIQHPLPGHAPKHVLSIMAYEDETVPNIASEALAGGLGLSIARTTAGGEPILDYTLPPPTILTAPVSGNLNIGGTPVTGVLVQMHTATHGMLARQQGHRTRDTRDRTFPRLPMAIDINNPIEAVQGLATSFALDYYSGRTPVVTDPK